MEKEKNMKNEIAQGEWYARHTQLWNCWVVKQMGGSFVKINEDQIARFTKREALILVNQLNKA